MNPLLHVLQCKGCFCPCMLYGDLNEHITGERDACCYTILCCLFPCTWGACCMGRVNRIKLRKMYGLRSDCDCLTHCLCHPCGMCQEAREVDVS